MVAVKRSIMFTSAQKLKFHQNNTAIHSTKKEENKQRLMMKKD
jgi:hypothetical protein